MSLTTDFSTLCWRKLKPLAALGVLLCLLGASTLRAEGIVARFAQLEPDEDSFRLNADFDIELTPTLEDALTRGVALYFVLELDVWRQRSWWFDKLLVSSKQTRKLSYNSLTRQYRLANSGLHQSFFRLDEALHVLGRVRGTPTLERSLLLPNHDHYAQVRMSLDTSQLPSLFQLDALASADWKLKTVAYSWDISP